MIKENTKYKVIKSGLVIQFNYTPLYTNYEASTPREVPVGAVIDVREFRENVTVYDGMPVRTKQMNSIITGFKRDRNYGNSTSCIVDLSRVQIDESFLEKNQIGN